jgi:hypothetical protein
MLPHCAPRPAPERTRLLGFSSPNIPVRFLVAEHTGVLIVKIDLTRIGPFPKPSRSEATRLDQRN